MSRQLGRWPRGPGEAELERLLPDRRALVFGERAAATASLLPSLLARRCCRPQPRAHAGDGAAQATTRTRRATRCERREGGYAVGARDGDSRLCARCSAGGMCGAWQHVCCCGSPVACAQFAGQVLHDGIHALKRSVRRALSAAAWSWNFCSMYDQPWKGCECGGGWQGSDGTPRTQIWVAGSGGGRRGSQRVSENEHRSLAGRGLVGASQPTRRARQCTSKVMHPWTQHRQRPQGRRRRCCSWCVSCH